MEKVVKQTKFYGTPDEGIAVLTEPNCPRRWRRLLGFVSRTG